MARRLRKMLGDRNAPCTQALLSLIDARSKADVCKWCIDYTQAHVLPIFEANCPGDARPRSALGAAREYLGGRMGFREVKDIIWYQDAGGTERDPVAQAAEDAVGQAASVVRYPSRWHAIAVYFYSAAAMGYDRLGLDRSAAEYEAFAERVCADMAAALRAIAPEGAAGQEK